MIVVNHDDGHEDITPIPLGGMRMLGNFLWILLWAWLGHWLSGLSIWLLLVGSQIAAWLSWPRLPAWPGWLLPSLGGWLNEAGDSLEESLGWCEHKIEVASYAVMLAIILLVSFRWAVVSGVQAR